MPDVRNKFQIKKFIDVLFQVLSQISCFEVNGISYGILQVVQSIRDPIITKAEVVVLY